MKSINELSCGNLVATAGMSEEGGEGSQILAYQKTPPGSGEDFI
jgi:hypothetical protein